MTRAGRQGRWLRAAILAAGLFLTLAGLVWAFLPATDPEFEVSVGVVGTPLAPWPAGPSVYSVILMIEVGLLFLSQWMFLGAGRRWAPRLASTGRASAY